MPNYSANYDTPEEIKAMAAHWSRSTSSLSFHSLRHSFTSTMTAAGVPEEVRMLLTGHSTKKAHKVYTHHEETQVWGAISALPAVL